MTESRLLPVAIRPEGAADRIVAAMQAGGGECAPVERAEALVMARGDIESLRDALARGPRLSWIQLASAGIERYLDLLDTRHVWTCAKGIYGPSVAEHALTLALAGVHRIPRFARARTWSPVDYHPLQGDTVLIIGGGGIARDLLALLRPFRVRVTVVRRHPEPMDGAERVLAPAHLRGALPGADVVILAPALTGETRGMIGPEELRAMKPAAWLVNVGRGALVQTEALVAALRGGEIGGAALDVTDPEPLPDGHPLWALDNCLITPHVANPPSFEHQAYARLVEDNVRRRRADEPLLGLVDVTLGY